MALRADIIKYADPAQAIAVEFTSTRVCNCPGNVCARVCGRRPRWLYSEGCRKDGQIGDDRPRGLGESSACAGSSVSASDGRHPYLVKVGDFVLGVVPPGPVARTTA